MAQNNYLMHHGIKGMKWGVRRTPEQLGHRKVSTKSDSIEERYSKAADAHNDWVDRYDKLERDLSTGKIDYDTYERKAAKLDKEYEKIDKEYSDAATKFLDKVYSSKEYKTLDKQYQKLNAELKDAFDRNDDKRMMEIYDEMEKLERAVSELTKLKHGNHSADDYLMHHGIKGMKWGVRRTPAQLGHKPTAGSRIKTKISDPEFQRKAAKAAKIALAVGAMYAGHKVLNNPEAIEAGKKVLSNVLAAKGTVKASAIKAITNSSEFKIAKAAGKAGLEGGKKALKFVGSDNFRKTVSGIGAVASTAGVLRKQIKDLKNKPEGDTVDKALGYAKKGSAIGETLNTLAKGGSASSSGSAKADSSGKPKTVFTGPGGQEKFSANRHLDTDDLKALKQYKINHPGMTTKEALDELGWLDKETTITHSVIHNGWSFNPMAGCRYIF